MSDSTKSESAEVVLLVHGTFAKAKTDEGDDWWQTRGRFREKLHQRLVSRNARFCVESFCWSGENCETARCEAGRELLNEKLLGYEANGWPYHIVAHSHGGSVVWHALQLAEKRARRLTHLQSWTTVGTPFLRFGMRWSVGAVFAGLINTFPFALFMLPPAFSVLLAGYSKEKHSLSQAWNSLLTDDFGLLMIVLAGTCGFLLYLPLLLFAITAWQVGSRKRTAKRVAQRCLDIWLGIFSQQDEAIHGLARTIELSDRRKRNRRERASSHGTILPAVRRSMGSLIILCFFSVVVCTYFVAGKHGVFALLLCVGVMAVLGLFYLLVKRFLFEYAWNVLARSLQGIGSWDVDDLGVVGLTAVETGPFVGCSSAAYVPIPTGMDAELINSANHRLKQLSETLLPDVRALLSQAILGGSSIAGALTELKDGIPTNVLVHCSYFDDPDVFKLVARHIELSTEQHADAPRCDLSDGWISSFKTKLRQHAI